MPTKSKGRREGLLGKLAIHFTVTAAVLAAGPLAVQVRAASDARRTAVVDAVEKVHRSVVSISSEKKASSHSRWPFSPEENQAPLVNGMGSGVLIDGRGYILTNHHVVDQVQGIMVQLFDGMTYPARRAPVRSGDGPGDHQDRSRAHARGDQGGDVVGLDGG